MLPCWRRKSFFRFSSFLNIFPHLLNLTIQKITFKLVSNLWWLFCEKHKVHGVCMKSHWKILKKLKCLGTILPPFFSPYFLNSSSVKNSYVFKNILMYIFIPEHIPAAHLHFSLYCIHFHLTIWFSCSNSVKEMLFSYFIRWYCNSEFTSNILF